LQNPIILSKIFYVKRIYKTNKGYLLSEVLISIFILMMTASATIGVVIYGYAAMNYNKNSMVAGMLLQECSESLIGLRDTNLLRFGYDKNNCWNVNDDVCPSLNKLTVDPYILEVSLNGASTFLPSSTDVLDLSDGIGETDKTYRLNYYDLNTSFDSDGDGNNTNDEDAYTTNAGLSESKFFRTMEIVLTDGPPATYIDGVCKVAWMEGNDPKQMQIPVHLTVY
jgi:hypothetical protein